MVIVNLRDPLTNDIIAHIAKMCRQGKKTVGLTSGVFDLFHILHLNYITRCREQCDFLIVGIDSDDLVKATKGPERPIFNEMQRAAIIDALKPVDVVFINYDLENDFGGLAKVFRPIIFKNDVFANRDIIGGKDAKRVVIVPDVNNVSSTSETIDKIIGQVIKQQ